MKKIKNKNGVCWCRGQFRVIFMELNTFFNVQERNGQNILCMTSSGASANVATLGDICLL